MPKILRILNRLNIGGPVLNAALLTHFLPAEYETILISGEAAANEKRATHLLDKFNIKPLILPEMGREINLVQDRSAYRKIKAIIKDYKPDIVHTHAAKPGAIGRLAAASCKVPVIVHTFHGHVFHSYFSPLKTRFYIGIERYLAKKSSAIIAISPIQKKELSETYRIAPANKIAVVPLGLFLEPFTTDQEVKRKQFRTEFNIDDETIAIAVIGRLAPVKNHSLFIKAIQHILQNTTKKIKAFVIGDGECMTSIVQQCKVLNIGFSSPASPNYSQPVIFTSWRSDIDVINAGIDIMALSSFNEGTPVSLIEAQASQKPIVSTICGGIQDVVIDGETGLLSPQKADAEFCENLLKLVEDETLRTRLSNKGASLASKNYSHLRLVNDIDALYKKLLSKT